MSNIILSDWLTEQEVPFAAQASATDPSPGMDQMAPPIDPNAPVTDPNVAGPPPAVDAPPQEVEAGGADLEPVAPDMPEEKEDKDYEVWKNDFIKSTVKNDTNDLLNTLHDMRDKEGLEPHQKKFIEDNMQIQFLRQHANIEKASKEIRKLMREELDSNNPAPSIVNHVYSVMGSNPELNEVYIKFTGLSGLKGDLHRKFIAALLGAVQVGSGSYLEDLVYVGTNDFRVNISTRFNSKFGDINLGKWTLKEDDPEKILSDPEMKRLENGSPEEREVLRHRIVIESISDRFKERSFLINVVGVDGTVNHFGWNISNSIKAAYSSGKVTIKTRLSENSEAMIDDDGNIVPLVDLSIVYLKPTGQLDEDGKPELEELSFMERRDGQLFLTADIQLVREASSSMQGILLNESPYNGNPSDLAILSRCVPSITEILMRQC